MRKSDSIANAISSSRILFALLILVVPALSVPFYVFYLLGAITDIADGMVARVLHQESALGAKLDTACDIAFVLVVLIKIFAVINLPGWLWIWTAVIAAVKVVNIISGFVICRKFVAVHSVMNKVTGGILFFLPFAFGLKLPEKIFSVICIIVCAVATFAAVQEGHYIRTGKEIKVMEE